MNDPKLPQIINHQYRNYVIQTTLRHCQGEQHVALVEAMRPHTAILEEQELQIWQRIFLFPGKILLGGNIRPL
ncbi:unnamed protein product [Urochloa humidicola]